MKRYAVRFEQEALTDLDDIYFYIAEQSGMGVTDRFTARLRGYCESFDAFPMRGSVMLNGIRTVTFEQSVQVAFVVGDDRVDVLRMTYRGREIETLLR